MAQMLFSQIQQAPGPNLGKVGKSLVYLPSIQLGKIIAIAMYTEGL